MGRIRYVHGVTLGSNRSGHLERLIRTGTRGACIRCPGLHDHSNLVSGVIDNHAVCREKRYAVGMQTRDRECVPSFRLYACCLRDGNTITRARWR